jgi:hypothetical protein
MQADGAPEGPLNAFIRINAMGEAELQQHLTTPALCGTLGEAEGRVSDENEEKVTNPNPDPNPHPNPSPTRRGRGCVW